MKFWKKYHGYFFIDEITIRRGMVNLFTYTHSSIFSLASVLFLKNHRTLVPKVHKSFTPSFRKRIILKILTAKSQQKKYCPKLNIKKYCTLYYLLFVQEYAGHGEKETQNPSATDQHPGPTPWKYAEKKIILNETNFATFSLMIWCSSLIDINLILI